MSDLLVPRSDVGEFRKRYKWMALAAFVAFGAIVVRLFQLQVLSGRRVPAIAHENIVRERDRSPRPAASSATHKARCSRRAALRTTSTSSPGRVMPSARPAHPRRPLRRRRRYLAAHRGRPPLNPEERTRFDARIRAACVSDEDKSPCWRPILVKEDLSRDLVAELRQHESELVGRRGRERSRALLPVQEPRGPRHRLRRRDRRRDSREVSAHGYETT
jgi:penicillin-binding protein 2